MPRNAFEVYEHVQKVVPDASSGPDALDAYSPAIRRLYAVSVLDGEINNGGFGQALFNGRYVWFDEAIAGLAAAGLDAHRRVMVDAAEYGLTQIDALSAARQGGTLEDFSDFARNSGFRPFDDRWYELPSIHEALDRFVVEQADQIWEPLAAADPQIAGLVAAEAERRATTIDLIASESEASPPVLAALGSVFAAKTAEGYPGRRYHRGTRYADEVEQLAIDRVKALFGAEHANVQPSSGVNANLAVYRATLKPGDTVLALRLDHGGHLSHGDRASITGAVYRFEHYGVRRDTETIDLDEVRDLARRHQPKLIVTGGSSYPRSIDYAAFGEIAREVGARLHVDLAHVAGLVAGGAAHASPIPHADTVSFTTYKTMLGPHGGVILAREELAKAVDRAIFPGTQGAPDFGRIAAKAVCFGIAATPAFRETQAAILANARALAEELATRGDRLVSGGTDNHMVLVDLRGRGLTGDVAEVALEEVRILTNRNVIPFEEGTPDRPSGLRLGTTAVSQRGLRVQELCEIAALIDETLRASASGPGGSDLRSIRARVKALVGTGGPIRVSAEG